MEHLQMQRQQSPTPAACWDVVLFNEDGELTEGSFGNIALKLDGQWLTPRREAGLLPGIGREHWLRDGRVREARLTQCDWTQASEVAWFNALRGWKSAIRLQVQFPEHLP
jgi:para-aminobenzoate synthetase / 4-amino-4-deoxychorismate lyase